MKATDLNKVLEMLVNEEQTEASGLLHEWFVGKFKQIHEELMAEDSTLSQDIEDDQEAIKSEEFYNEDEDEESGDVSDELPTDDIEGDAPVDDMDGAPADDMPAEVTISDTIEDLEAVMARLKAEFAEITGDVGAEDEVVGDVGEPADMGDVEPVDGDMELADEGVMESEDSNEDDEDASEEVTESEDDFADLEESWTLEPVKDPNLSGGKEIGAQGAKVNVNDKSPLPNHKPADRVGGKAVEIKAEEHHGYDREPSPEVKSKPLLKNQVKKSTDGRTGVSKEGDKSAMLNKKDGFGSDSPKSPIGAGAADLRGSDFKRK